MDGINLVELFWPVKEEEEFGTHEFLGKFITMLIIGTVIQFYGSKLIFPIILL